MSNQLIPDEQFQTAIPTEDGILTVQSLNTESPSNNDLLETYDINEEFLGSTIEYENLESDNELLNIPETTELQIDGSTIPNETLESDNELITNATTSDGDTIIVDMQYETLDPESDLLETDETVEDVEPLVYSQGTCFDNLQSNALITSIDALYRYLCEVLIRFDADPDYYQKEDYKFLIRTITNSLIYLYSRDREIGDLEKVVRFVGVCDLLTDPFDDAELENYAFPGIYLADKAGTYPGFELVLTESELNESIVLFIPYIQDGFFVNYIKQTYSINLDNMVPYVGATKDLDLNTKNIYTSGIRLNTSAPYLLSTPGDIG